MKIVVYISSFLGLLIGFGIQAFAESTYHNYIKVRIFNANRILEPDKSVYENLNESDPRTFLRLDGIDQRFIRTMNDYESRLQLDSACDPRTTNEKYLFNTRFRPLNCRKSSTPAPTNVQFFSRWNPYDHRYDENYVVGEESRKRHVRLGLLREEDGGWYLKDGYTCNWKISKSGENPTNILLEKENQPCRYLDTVLELGNYHAEIVVFENGSNPFSTGKLDFTIKDILVVAMGDSFGSGEGNPHTYIVSQSEVDQNGLYRPKPALWLDQRCHRSLYSSSGQVAALLANKYRSNREIGISFSLINTACSGAESDFGLMYAYRGRETADQATTLWTRTKGGRPAQKSELDEGYFDFDELKVSTEPRGSEEVPAVADIPAQIEQLANALCRSEGEIKICRDPDAIILYIGVNDIRFTEQLFRLLQNCSEEDECATKALAEVKSGIEKLKSNISNFKEKMVEIGFYKEMDTSKLPVFVVTYPHPFTKPGKNNEIALCDDTELRDEDGATVLGFPESLFFKGISKAGAQWAEKQILTPLNTTLRSLDKEPFNWNIVETEHIMDNHGYCADKRWFNTFKDAEKKQGKVPQDYVVDTLVCNDTEENNACTGKLQPAALPTGTMHPNYFGHRAVAAKLIHALEEKFHYFKN